MFSEILLLCSLFNQSQNAKTCTPYLRHFTFKSLSFSELGATFSSYMLLWCAGGLGFQLNLAKQRPYYVCIRKPIPWFH